MNIIVACDKNWGIGKDGHLLCHLSGDLKYFKEMTLGKTVVMGRVTLESLPGGKGLPGRRNIVITCNPDYQAENAEVVHDFDELDAALAAPPFAPAVSRPFISWAVSVDTHSSTIFPPASSTP